MWHLLKKKITRPWNKVIDVRIYYKISSRSKNHKPRFWEINSHSVLLTRIRLLMKTVERICIFWIGCKKCLLSDINPFVILGAPSTSLLYSWICDRAEASVCRSRRVEQNDKCCQQLERRKFISQWFVQYTGYNEVGKNPLNIKLYWSLSIFGVASK